jgi:hypothetical protein
LAQELCDANTRQSVNHNITGFQRLRVSVGHGYAGTGPPEHRRVSRTIAKRDHVSLINAHIVSQCG